MTRKAGARLRLTEVISGETVQTVLDAEDHETAVRHAAAIREHAGKVEWLKLDPRHSVRIRHVVAAEVL